VGGNQPTEFILTISAEPDWSLVPYDSMMSLQRPSLMRGTIARQSIISRRGSESNEQTTNAQHDDGESGHEGLHEQEHYLQPSIHLFSLLHLNCKTPTRFCHDDSARCACPDLRHPLSQALRWNLSALRHHPIAESLIRCDMSSFFTKS
jgi:hypothetical protein